MVCFVLQGESGKLREDGHKQEEQDKQNSPLDVKLARHFG
jgi:hypothetical protein